MAAIRLQRTGTRFTSLREEKITEESWRDVSEWNFSGLDAEAKAVEIERIIWAVRLAMAKEIHNDYGISQAWWRLIYDDSRWVQIGAQRVLLKKSVVLVGPIRQYLDADKVDEDAIKAALTDPESLLSEEEPELEENPLDALCAETVPSGTVVEILDQWGLPVDTTEVT